MQIMFCFVLVKKDNRGEVLTYVFESISVVIPIKKSTEMFSRFWKEKKKVHIIFDLWRYFLLWLEI